MQARSVVQISNSTTIVIAIWSLVDSGSSVHAINASKLLQHAPKLAAPKGHEGFKAANGTRIPHGGFVSTTVKFQEGNSRDIQWNNAQVDMPILSTKKLNKDGGRLIYDEDEGWIVNKRSGDANHFISAVGVYFCNLLLPKELLGAQPPSQGFRLPG